MKTDAHLQRDVLDELSWDPSIDETQIGVTCHEGVVTLNGHVSAYAEKHAAEEAAKRVHGVHAVANEIEVRPHELHLRDDEDIAAAALHALDWDARVPHDRLQLVVENGWIKLVGNVKWRYEKEAAERAIRHLKGIRGVTNELQIDPPETVNETKANVEAAFRRSAVIDSRRITVETEQGIVVLTGDVHSLAERDEAERTAWSARGVVSVENCLTITPWGVGPAEEWGY